MKWRVQGMCDNAGMIFCGRVFHGWKEGVVIDKWRWEAEWTCRRVAGSVNKVTEETDSM